MAASATKPAAYRTVLLLVAACCTGILLFCLGKWYADHQNSAYAHPPAEFRETANKVKPGMTLAKAKLIMMPVSTKCVESSGSAVFVLEWDRNRQFVIPVVLTYYLNLKLDENGRIIEAEFSDG